VCLRAEQLQLFWQLKLPGLCLLLKNVGGQSKRIENSPSQTPFISGKDIPGECQHQMSRAKSSIFLRDFFGHIEAERFVNSISLPELSNFKTN